MEKLKVAVIGAGMRGRDTYAAQALKPFPPIEVVAVAEPDAERRKLFQSMYSLTDSMCFENGDALLAAPKLADAVFVCTQDREHHSPTCQALKKGYDVLVEKPMAVDAAECRAMIDCAQQEGRTIAVCHVLRYTPFFMTIKQLLDDKAIGHIVTVEHTENVAYWHYAHSYVRGNWRNTAQSSPMLLAKSCHDLDILSWLINRKCLSISSFGNLKHFKKENAPAGAPARCLDGCPHWTTCPYYAPRLYNDTQSDWQMQYTRRAVTPQPSDEALAHALETGPYGRCVYHCDNDVVDHQVVNMAFEDDITAAFTMTAFTMTNNRTTRILGTKGELHGSMEDNIIEYRDFLTNTRHTITLDQSEEGHGGGDLGILVDFVDAVRKGSESRSSARLSLQSHLMAFAAEEARLQSRVVDMAAFEATLVKGQ